MYQRQEHDHERRAYEDAWVVQDRLRQVPLTDSVFRRARRRVTGVLRAIDLGRGLGRARPDATAPRT